MNSHEKLPEVEKLAGLEAVKKHVYNNRVPADNNRVKCVDGGYQPGQADGAIAVPGGHLGISMTLVSLGYDAQTAFSLVKEFALRRGEKYGWHSDTHTEHPQGDAHQHHHEVGCGHCDKAINQAQFYGADRVVIKELLQTVKNAAKNDPTGEVMDYVELNRDHKELGILVVDGLTQTVKPWEKNEISDRQYFIYDRVRHQQYLFQLAQFLPVQAVDRPHHYQALWDNSWKQTLSTLGLLGTSQGAPLYLVNVDATDKSQWQISEIGKAPLTAPTWK